MGAFPGRDWRCAEDGCSPDESIYYVLDYYQWRIQGGGPPFQKIIKNEDLFLYNFLVQNVFYQYLYTI